VTTMKRVEIAGRAIGSDAPPFVIAELSGNHNGDLGRAMRLVEAAAHAGADAVKLQTYTADTITIDHDGPEFLIKGGLWDGRRLYDLYQEAHTPWEWHEALFARGRELGMVVLSSPFDTTAVDFLETLDAPAYKIASFEIIDTPLIRHAAATGKPLIISTGMARRDEIADAVAAARETSDAGLVLLHCTSGYPTPPEDSNLRTIPDLARTFDAVTGLSDHTPGIAVSMAAIALGAAVIEKHVTLARADGGPDAAFSLEPDELKALVEGCRQAHAVLGSVRGDPSLSEAGNLVLRRSLYAVTDIGQGEVFSTANVRSIRPGHGLAPKLLPDVLGRRAATNLSRGTALKPEHIKVGKSER
jgi:pseudaminic acid synthase